MPTEPQPLSDSLRATLRDAGDCHDHTPDCSCLPIRVVVDQHGHYWRDYGDNWSMCPVSTENVATEPVTEFHRAGEGGDFEMDPEKIALARLELEVEWAIQWLESGRTDQAEGDAATAARLRAALAASGEDWPCDAATPAPDPEPDDETLLEAFGGDAQAVADYRRDNPAPAPDPVLREARIKDIVDPIIGEYIGGPYPQVPFLVLSEFSRVLVAALARALAESTPTTPDPSCICGEPVPVAGYCHDIDGDFWPGHGHPEAATPTPDPVLRDALDVERLARAIVKACREQGERLWPRDGAKYHGHGWPAYSEWTNGRNTTADLVVSDLAASILAYLPESTPTAPEAEA